MKRRFPDAALKRYIRRGHKTVEGWFSQFDAHLIASIGDIQTEEEIGGGVGEIGVHHGRLFILLYLLLHIGEKTFCVDIFDLQEFNIDQSGCGDEDIFKRQVERHAKCLDSIHIIKANSTSITAADVISAAGKIRLFSIDGGHTPEITYNDLCIAHDSLCDAGVIILDDVFNNIFPGVSEGLYKFFMREGVRIAPFAVSEDKTFLCNVKYANMYREKLRSRYRHMPKRNMLCKESHFLGSDVDIYFRQKGIINAFYGTRFWGTARESFPGRVARGLKRKYSRGLR